MLQSIHVKNFALIDEVEINLGTGFNVLTGETGAGKSIIIDAVNFALGKRISKDIVRDDADYALSELVFSTDTPDEKNALSELNIPSDDGQIIISKKIVGGRASARINGETVTSAQLKQLAAHLIDIYGQHEQASLLTKSKHLEILDSFMDEQTLKLKDELKGKYSEYSRQTEKLNNIKKDESDTSRKLSLAKYELNEILSANLTKGEDEALEAQYRKMTNAKKIADLIASAHLITGYDNEGAGALIGRALSNVKNACGYDDSVSDLEMLLTDIDGLLNDFNRQIAAYEESLEFSDEDFINTENRLNLINSLKAKYGSTIEDIETYAGKKQEEIDTYENFDEYVNNLLKTVQKLKDEVLNLCAEISKARIKTAAELSKNIENALKDLNFQDAQFEIRVTPDEEALTYDGYDDVEMYINANVGERLRPVTEVASGGELSRIMLAIKSVLADKDNIGTLIFDEIDTGISGRTAQKISEKIGHIAKKHQIICVTHLPQIAAMADSHFEISKSVKDNRTATGVKNLSDDEIINELARMLGGAEITDAVLKNAGEMKELANEIKKR